MPTIGATAALNSAAKSDGASGWMAGDGSSIWMCAGTRRDEPLELGAQDRHERLGRGVAFGYTSPGPVRSRPDRVYGPGSVTLSGRVARPEAYRNSSTTPSPSGAAIGSSTSNRCCWSWPPAPRTPIRGQSPDAGQVPVELGGEEARPPHLAVADEVDAGVLLVAQREVDRVVQHLREIDRPELAALGGRDPGHEPRRARVRPDDAGPEPFGHAVIPFDNSCFRFRFGCRGHDRPAAIDGQ